MIKCLRCGRLCRPGSLCQCVHQARATAPAQLPDEVGHLSLGFLLIDATRYNLGRPSESARQFAFALAKTLPQIAEPVRQQLVQDIGQALSKDAVTQAVHAGNVMANRPAGFEAADRQGWQGVLLVAKELGTVPNEFRAAPGSPMGV